MSMHRRRGARVARRNAAHRVRVEHDGSTLLIHLSGEDGDGWTTIAVDRSTRRWAVAQDHRQIDAARAAYEQLHGQLDER